MDRLRKIVVLLRHSKIRLHLVFIFTATIFISTLLEASAFSLIIPLLKGLIDRNFVFLKELSYIGPYLNLYLTNDSNANIYLFVIIIISIYGLMMLKCAMLYISHVLLFKELRSINSNLRILILNRYLSFGKLYYDQTSQGYMHQVLVAFTMYLSNYANILFRFLNRFFLFLTYSILMVIISWKLFLFSSLAFPLFHIFTKRIVENLKKNSIQHGKMEAKMGEMISNIISCAPLIQATMKQDSEREKFKFCSENVRDADYLKDKKACLLNPLQESLAITILMCLVFFGGILIICGYKTNISQFLVFIVLLKRCSSNMGFYNEIKSLLAQAKGTAEHVIKIFDDKDKFIVPDGNIQCSGIKNRIEFKNLDFGYIHGQSVLQNLNLTIPKGQMTAIVGRTGSGKSTLLSLLVRLYDSSPKSIFFDDIDIREFSLKSLRGKVALVVQNSIIFHASIRYNVTFGS